MTNTIPFSLARGCLTDIVNEAAYANKRTILTRKGKKVAAIKAGAIEMNWFAVASEFQRDWRNDGDKLKKLLQEHLVPYANLISSYEARK